MRREGKIRKGRGKEMKGRKGKGKLRKENERK